VAFDALNKGPRDEKSPRRRGPFVIGGGAEGDNPELMSTEIQKNPRRWREIDVRTKKNLAFKPLISGVGVGRGAMNIITFRSSRDDEVTTAYRLSLPIVTVHRRLLRGLQRNALDRDTWDAHHPDRL
jgi:hypothetical protein